MTESDIIKGIKEIYKKAAEEAKKFVDKNIDDMLYKKDTVVLYGNKKYLIDTCEIRILPPVFGHNLLIVYKCKYITKTGKPGKRTVEIGHKKIKVCQPKS